MQYRFVFLSALCGALIATPAAWSPAVGAPRAAALERPTLQAQQGQYFRWSVPSGWRVNETANGVDLVAPDGKTLVSSALVHSSPGRPSPRDFLTMVMRQVNPTARIHASAPLPGRPGVWGEWRCEEFVLSGLHQGTPVHMRATVALSAGHGRYSATMTLYQAPAASWDHDRLWLPAIAQSIVVTNGGQVARQDTVMLPRNNPLDNSGLIESWRQKGLSDDRISQGRREGTMGYTRLEDPSTGRRYEMPLEAYDGKVGGYRNPMRPTELLRRLPPGY